jgi:hypothetical protein
MATEVNLIIAYARRYSPSATLGKEKRIIEAKLESPWTINRASIQTETQFACSRRKSFLIYTRVEIKLIPSE